MDSSRLNGKGNEAIAARAERAARFASDLAEACLQNVWVQAFMDDPEFPVCSEAALRRDPIVRVEFEQACAIGAIGETLAATRSKHWGRGPKIAPLAKDDFFYPERITYVFREDSLFHQRFLQRRKLKALLGDRKSLVTTAKKNTLARFLEVLSSKDGYIIRQSLGLSPRDFWRLCRAREFTDLPDQPLRIVTTQELQGIADKPVQLRLDFGQ